MPLGWLDQHAKRYNWLLHVHYWDHHLGILLDALASHGVLGETAWRLGREALYESGDVHEVHDLVPSHPTLAQELADRLAAWRQADLSLAGAPADPMEAGRYEGPG